MTGCLLFSAALTEKRSCCLLVVRDTNSAHFPFLQLASLESLFICAPSEMEESGLRPRASVSEGPHSCPAPESPSLPALVTSSLVSQPTQKPEPDAVRP